MMAGWARLKFPHLIYGSVASSAPVQAQVDYIGYMDVVSDSLSAENVGGSKLCRGIKILSDFPNGKQAKTLNATASKSKPKFKCSFDETHSFNPQALL